MTALFVTGTDTGVGKTVVACAIAAAVREAGRRIVALKPVETGCEVRDGQLVPADATALWHAQGGSGPLPDWLCRFRYQRPASPEAAARCGTGPVDVQQLRRDWRSSTSLADVAILEGAGGLLVPLSSALMLCDFVAELQLPVVVVGRAGLGTINHTLLTAEAARARGLEVLGFVLNGWRDDDERSFAEENARDIEHHGRVRCLGLFPWLAGLDPATLAEAARTHLHKLVPESR